MQDELDELCEDYLYERFEVKVDFAIEESLPRLLQDGLIQHAAGKDDPRLVAVPLEVAHDRLIQKWQTCGSPPVLVCLGCSLVLLGLGNVLPGGCWCCCHCPDTARQASCGTPALRLTRTAA